MIFKQAFNQKVNCQNFFFLIQDTETANFMILLSSSILLSFHTMNSISLQL